MTRQAQDEPELRPAISFHNLIAALAAIAAGALAAAILLPAWLPGLVTSLAGPEPKVFWYLSRASGLVAFVLLWLSTALGLLITSKTARSWPGGPAAFDLHQYTALLGLGFVVFHGLILVGDRRYALGAVLVPFLSTAHRPFWVGIGQVAFYLMALVALSFYARRAIGHRRWRLIHFLSFAVFLLALAHGLLAGTDSAAPWVKALYWTSGGSVLFLTLYRALYRQPNGQRRAASHSIAR